MEVEEDGGYCTLSPSAEVMLQGGGGGRGDFVVVYSLGREGLDQNWLIFFKDFSLKQDASVRDSVRTEKCYASDYELVCIF